MNREQIEARIADLEAKNEAATGWGAAVGARHEEIKGLKRALDALDHPSRSAGSESGKPAGCEPCSWPECGCQYSPAPIVEPKTETELEAILNSEDTRPCTVLPDGNVLYPTDDICECPKCGRNHRKLGNPPWVSRLSAANEHGLLPCPFCGPGQSMVDPWFDDVSKRWAIGCGRCGASSGRSIHAEGSKEAAIKSWNTRGLFLNEPQAAREAMEKARSFIELELACRGPDVAGHGLDALNALDRALAVSLRERWTEF